MSNFVWPYGVTHNLLGSSVPGILQTRILEWDAIPSSKGSCCPRDWTLVSYVSCIERHLGNSMYFSSNVIMQKFTLNFLLTLYLVIEHLYVCTQLILIIQGPYSIWYHWEHGTGDHWTALLVITHRVRLAVRLWSHFCQWIDIKNLAYVFSIKNILFNIFCYKLDNK